MIKKFSDYEYGAFCLDYSTNDKLGVIEDTTNRTILVKLLRCTSSNGKLVFLAEYMERRTLGRLQHKLMQAGGCIHRQLMQAGRVHHQLLMAAGCDLPYAVANGDHHGAKEEEEE